VRAHTYTYTHTYTHIHTHTRLKMIYNRERVRAHIHPCTHIHTYYGSRETWHADMTHCNTLQRNLTHCNTLQHTATHCNTLHHTATHCNIGVEENFVTAYQVYTSSCSAIEDTLSGGKKGPSVARGVCEEEKECGEEWVAGPMLLGNSDASMCVAVCCSVLQCVAVCCSVLQCVAVCCSTVGIRLLLGNSDANMCVYVSISFVSFFILSLSLSFSLPLDCF